LLPKVCGNLDEPIADQALLPVYMLCEAAKKEVTVVLSGEGADELFGGYSYYQNTNKSDFRQRIKNLIRRKKTLKSSPFLNEHLLRTSSGFPLISDHSFRKDLLRSEGVTTPFDNYLTNLMVGNLPLPDKQISDLKSWLVDDLLVKLDRMTMAHSIEG